MPPFPVTLASEGSCVRDLLPKRTSTYTYILYYPLISNINKKTRLKPIPQNSFWTVPYPLPPCTASLMMPKKKTWGSAHHNSNRATRRCPMFHATFSEISNDAAFGQIHLPFLTCFIATWQSPLRSWLKCQTYVPRPRNPHAEIKGLLRSYWRKPLVSKLLIRPYLWQGGGIVRQGQFFD